MDYIIDNPRVTHPSAGSLGFCVPFAGFGAATAPSLSGAKSMLSQGNSLMAKAMPPPAKAAIDSLPIAKQWKTDLKTKPLTVFYIIAQIARDKVVEFIARTEKKSKVQRTKDSKGYGIYDIGGIGGFKVQPTAADPPAMLAAKWLTVVNKNPVAAAAVAVEMAIELHAAPANAAIAAAFSAGEPLKNIIEKTTGIKLPPPPKFPVPQIPIPPLPKIPWLGLGAAVVDDAAAAAAAAEAAAVGGGEAAAPAAVAEVSLWDLGLKAIGGAVVLAPSVVPMLVQVAQGAMPAAPSQSQLNATGSTAAFDSYAANASGDIAPARGLWGIPMPVVIGGVAVAGLGIVAVLWPKRRSA